MRNYSFALFFFVLFLPCIGYSQDDARTGKPFAEQENRLIDAVGKYTSNDYVSAVNILSGIISETPENDAAYYYMALSKLAVGETDVAETYFERAVELDPSNFWYRYRLAVYYGVTARQEKTIEILEHLLVEFPKKSQVYYDLFEACAKAGKLERALEVLDSIETVFGPSEPVAMYRFNILIQMERQEEAIQSLRDYNDQYSSVMVLTTLADYEMSVYNDSLAHVYYDEVLEQMPDYTPALLGKAEAYRMTRKNDEYFETLDRFVSSSNISAYEKSEYLSALVTKSVPLFLKSISSRLDSIMNKAVSVHPSDTLLLPVKAIYHVKIDEDERADSCLRVNVEQNPEALSAWGAYSDFLSYRKRWKDLSGLAVKGYAAFPKEYGFLETEIYAEYNLKAYDKVLGICEEMLEVADGDTVRMVNAYSTMGDIHHLRNEQKQSFRCYESALELAPSNLYVLNNYAYYLSVARKKLKKAAQMSKITVEAEPENSTYLDTYGWILFLQGKKEEAKVFFKKAMLYGGKESVVVMDHYAEVLYALGEYDLASVYWNRIESSGKSEEIPDFVERVQKRKKSMKK